MSQLVFFLCFLIATSLGFNPSPSYRSTVMDGQKPILRYGGDDDYEDAPPSPVLRFSNHDSDDKTEPPWVAQLRSNIMKVMKKEGSNAGPDIQKLIADADEKVNNQQSSPGRSPLLLHMDSIELDPQLPSEKGPMWMRKLKSSVKDLMKTYEKDEINTLVEPIVEKMQEDYDIDIEGIDVDPFGKIDVIFKSRKPEVPESQADQSDRNTSPFAASMPPSMMGMGGMPPNAMGQSGMPPNGMGQSELLPNIMRIGRLPPNGMGHGDMGNGGRIPPSFVGQGGVPPNLMEPGGRVPPSLMGQSGMTPSMMDHGGGMPPSLMGRSGIPPNMMDHGGGMPPSLMGQRGMPPSMMGPGGNPQNTLRQRNIPQGTFIPILPPFGR